MKTEQKKHSITLPLVFCIALLGFVGYYAFLVIGGGRALAPLEAAMVAVVAGVSLFCMLLLFQIRRLYRDLGSASEYVPAKEANLRIEELESQNAESMRKLNTILNQVEVLSAMREISLLASQDVDFERLVEHALRLVEQVAGSREISLFLRSSDNEKIIKVRVHRAEGKTLFEKDIDASKIDSDHVAEVARYGNVKREETDTLLDLTVPVMVDREILGVVKAKIDKEDMTPKKLERAELALRNLVNHISLAIKTPTLYDRAVLDGLTGLYTKRHLMAELAKLFAGAKRLSKSLAIIMFDIDHFKNINDTHGHLTGDIVLREVASIVKQQIREYDSAYRYGGEEMCVLLPDTDARSAVAVAQRIREAIEGAHFKGDQNQHVPLTISGGVAVHKKYMDKIEHLISEADSALYEAKEAGRNQVKYWKQRKVQK